MKIKIKREGGFIGITSKADLDYDDLTKEEQNALNALAEQSLQKNEDAKVKMGAQTMSASAIEAKPNESEDVKSEPQTRGLTTDESPIDSHTSMDNGLELAEQNIPHNTQSGMMRDGFSYSVLMKKNGKKVSLQFDDMTAPPEIVEMFQKYVQY
jgi:hypothetical protein